MNNFFSTVVNVNNLVKEIEVLKSKFGKPIDVVTDLTPGEERIVIKSNKPNIAKEFYDYYGESLQEVNLEGYPCMDNGSYWNTLDDVNSVSLCIEKSDFILHRGATLYIGGKRSSNFEIYDIDCIKKTILKFLRELFEGVSVKELSKDVKFSTISYEDKILLKTLIVCEDMESFYFVRDGINDLDPEWVEEDLGCQISMGVLEKEKIVNGYPCVEILTWCK